MHLTRALSCKRPGFWERHEGGASLPRSFAGFLPIIGGRDRAGHVPALFAFGMRYIAPGNTPPSMSRFCPVM
jgi:hypothetical protein